MKECDFFLHDSNDRVRWQGKVDVPFDNNGDFDEDVLEDIASELLAGKELCVSAQIDLGDDTYDYHFPGRSDGI